MRSLEKLLIATVHKEGSEWQPVFPLANTSPGTLSKCIFVITDEITKRTSGFHSSSHVLSLKQATSVCLKNSL